MPTDAELLSQYASHRSETAFSELVRRHLDGVYSAALRRVGGDAHLAQDISQQVFSALARDAARLSRHPFLVGWLYRSTRNAAANLVRSEQRRKKREAEVLAMDDLRSANAPEPDWARLAAVLDTMIDQLSESDRSAVLLRYVDRRNFAEIGRVLRVSEDAARMRVDRALNKLRDLLARKGVRSSAAALGLALGENAVLAAPGGLAPSIAVTAMQASASVAALAVSAVQIMTRTKLVLTVVGALALIGAVGLAGWAIHERIATEAALAAARRDYAAEAERLRLAQMDAARRAKSYLVAQRKAVAPPPTAADLNAEGQAFLSRHPDVKQALDAYARGKVNWRYGRLMKSLNLTPAQIERFQDLMMHRFQLGAQLADGNMVPLRPGDDRGSSNASGPLKELLGDAGWKQYVAYTQTMDARLTMGEMAGDLWTSDSPLTTAQSDQLLKVFRSSRTSVRPMLTTYDWNALVPQAQQFLSPTQLEALNHARAENELKAEWDKLATRQ